MGTLLRILVGTAIAVLLGLAGCAHNGAWSMADAATVAALAPTGALRVGVYQGSPTSLVRDPTTHREVGVAHDLGAALGKRMGVPVTFVEFSRVAEVIEGLKAGSVDFTFTNATPSRARDVDFTRYLVRLELGILVPAQSARVSFADVDKPGVRIGVSQGSSSQTAVPQKFRNATVVPVASLTLAQQMLRNQELDAFGTNKGILFEMRDGLPGSQVLADQWGLESLAIAVPKGREAGMVYLRQFARDVGKSGELQSMIARSGLRGTASGD